MRERKTLLSALLLQSLVVPAIANAELITLESHIPKNLMEAENIGPLEARQELEISILLDLNHKEDLDKTITDLYDPKSPIYNQFLSSEEFMQRFSPTEEQVSDVTQFLQDNGLTVRTVDANRMIVHASGSIANVSAAFHTTISQYRLHDSRIVYAPSRELQVPSGLSIMSVQGLENMSRLRNHMRRRDTTRDDDMGLTPATIRTAYEIPEHLQGSGQIAAVVEFDAYYPSDIAEYNQTFYPNLPPVPLENIYVDGATNTNPGKGSVEVALDIELMIALAPKLAKILVYEAPNTNKGGLDMYNQVAIDNRSKSISTSWGLSENLITRAYLRAEANIFKQFAAQGQALYAASGDNGAYDDADSPKKLIVDDPSAQPYVVSVGGTRLTTDADGSYVSESTWNGLNHNGGGGGGGLSAVWAIPSWQKKALKPGLQKSLTRRNVPDVSLNSDPETGYAVYSSSQWIIVGGTSCAAPLWAAFGALVNEQRAEKGRGPMGLPTPILYNIGASTSYAHTFHDIADGSSNGNAKPPLGYHAVKGYDNATGWGTFRGADLINELSTK